MQCKNILKQSVEFSGIGLHSGKTVHVKMVPGEEGIGIRFVRTDITPNAVIAADVNNVFTTNRGTTLKSGEATIATIEHLLAAANALQIEDLWVYVDGPEIPILDGSAAIFIEKLNMAGLEEIQSNRDIYVVSEAFNFVDSETGSEYAIYPSDHLELSTILNFSDDTLGDMVAVMKTKADFVGNMADSRTFVFLSEVEKLFDAGLIKGGDIDNAVVIVDKKLNEAETGQLKVKLGKPNAVIADGVISTTPLRHRNEPARHKLLDLLGDLTLVGRDIKAKIVAIRPGHTSNVALAKILKAKYIEAKRNASKPSYDPNAEPLMSVEDIKKLLPHRYPFLLVDKVIELSPTHIVGIKNVTSNEDFFKGTFQAIPSFRSIADGSTRTNRGILALNAVRENDSEVWDTYFLKMDNVKFKAKVLPGDTIILRMELMAPIRRGIIQMMGTAYVGSKLVSEGELTAQIVKRQND